MSAISATGSKAVRLVDNEQFEREKLYQATMNMFRAMVEKGIITKAQYNVIDAKCCKNTGHYWEVYFQKTLAI